MIAELVLARHLFPAYYDVDLMAMIEVRVGKIPPAVLSGASAEAGCPWPRELGGSPPARVPDCAAQGRHRRAPPSAGNSYTAARMKATDPTRSCTDREFKPGFGVTSE